MTLGEALFSVLTGYAPLTALVGQRVFPGRIPQESATPALRYSVISGVPASSLSGAHADTAKGSRVQVDAYARTYLEARSVADAVQLALGDLAQPTPGLSAWLLGERDLFDDVTQLHCVSMDFNVWR